MAKDKSLGADGEPKYFFSKEKADAFIEKKKLQDTHHSFGIDGVWKILPKTDGAGAG